MSPVQTELLKNMRDGCHIRHLDRRSELAHKNEGSITWKVHHRTFEWAYVNEMIEHTGYDGRHYIFTITTKGLIHINSH